MGERVLRRQYALAPISLIESRIISNIVGVLAPWLRPQKLALFPSRMRLHVPGTDSYFFPNVLVVRRPPVTQALPRCLQHHGGRRLPWNEHGPAPAKKKGEH